MSHPRLRHGGLRCAAKAICLWAVLSPGAATVWATPQFRPTLVYQKDGEWHVSGLGGYAIIVKGPTKGKTISVSIDEALSKQDYDRYVEQTTAGPIWEECALDYFITIDGRRHFCIRTRWDHRFVFDLTVPEHLTDLGKIEKTLEAAERRQVLSILKDAADSPSEPKVTSAGLRRLKASVRLAGRLKLEQTGAYLQKLEACGFVHSWGGPLMEDVEEGEINPFVCGDLELRRMVQTALRRLGRRPAGLPCTEFRFESSPGLGRPFQPPKFTEPRAQRVAGVRPGMKPLQVLNALGAPDSVHTQFDAWQYDVDADRPYTLFVVWEDGLEVGELKKIEPPLWKSAAPDGLDPSKHFELDRPSVEELGEPDPRARP